MRRRVLVCTANKPEGWCHSTTSGQGIVTLNIFRILLDGTIGYHPYWNGKKWKYKTFEQLEAIQRTTDKIGLLCGSLVEYHNRPM